MMREERGKKTWRNAFALSFINKDKMLENYTEEKQTFAVLPIDLHDGSRGPSWTDCEKILWEIIKIKLNCKH